MKKKALRDFRHNPEKLLGPNYSFLALSGRSGIEFIAIPVGEEMLQKFGREVAALEARMSLHADALNYMDLGLREDDVLAEIELDIDTYRKNRDHGG